MKLIVAGSRTFQDYTLLSSVLGTHRHPITELLHGGARGADRLAFRWAVRHHGVTVQFVRIVPVSMFNDFNNLGAR